MFIFITDMPKKKIINRWFITFKTNWEKNMYPKKIKILLKREIIKFNTLK